MSTGDWRSFVRIQVKNSYNSIRQGVAHKIASVVVLRKNRLKKVVMGFVELLHTLYNG